MKKLSLLSVLVMMSLMLSSCWQFNRDQRLKDAENDGKATLLEAENSKKALIEQAKAENESATLQAEARIKIAKAEAQAEIERAKGVAEANKIIGESLRGNNEYLRYLQIDAIRGSKGEKIYIPTEAGLPIIERK
jgi:regulator of protease activity HflC (stomatin/prohibitin superfamily)